ncbi:MAG: hypothetical protein U1F87_17515 [Kiritimatiellia bacterium]
MRSNEFCVGSAGLYNQGYVKEPRSFYCPGDRVRRVTAAEDGAHYGQHGASTGIRTRIRRSG